MRAHSVTFACLPGTAINVELTQTQASNTPTDPSQSGQLVTLLNTLYFVFKFSFLPSYRVKYYDYMFK